MSFNNEYEPIYIFLGNPWGNLPEMYPGQHEGKPFVPNGIRSPNPDILSNENVSIQKDTTDKTYKPKKLSMKQEEQEEKCRNFIKKDRKFIENELKKYKLKWGLD